MMWYAAATTLHHWLRTGQVVYILNSVRGRVV